MKELQNNLSYLKQCLEALKQCEGTEAITFEVRKEIHHLERMMENRGLWLERLSIIGGVVAVLPLIFLMGLILCLAQ